METQITMTKTKSTMRRIDYDFDKKLQEMSMIMNKPITHVTREMKDIFGDYEQKVRKKKK